MLNNCCLCYPTVTGCTTPPKSKCPGGKCLILPHLLIGSANSVGPCGESGFIPFEDVGIDTTLCGNTTPVYKIISHSNIFTNVTISPSGVNFTTTEDNGFKPAGIITWGVSCGQYSETSTITIIIKNLCAGSQCESTEVCDKCTGLCVEKEGDMEIGSQGGAGFNYGDIIIY